MALDSLLRPGMGVSDRQCSWYLVHLAKDEPSAPWVSIYQRRTLGTSHWDAFYQYRSAEKALAMYIYLFDTEHPELRELLLMGPPCTQRVVAALERLTPIPTTRLIRGNVIPEHGCYRLARFKVGGKPESAGKDIGLQVTGSESEYQPDLELFKTVVCDLAETLSVSPSTISEQVLLQALARRALWAVGASVTSDQQALEVDADLRKFDPYFGMVKLDLGNPVQCTVMVEIMFHDDVVLRTASTIIESAMSVFHAILWIGRHKIVSFIGSSGNRVGDWGDHSARKACG